MQQMGKYSCFLTEKGDVVVVIPFMGQGGPKNPKIMYDNGEHAVFYKTKTVSVILDY